MHPALISALTPAVVGLIVFLVLLYALKEWLEPSTPSWRGKTLPYRIRDDLLSNAERSFHRVLLGVAADRYLVLAKVSLGDLFCVFRGNWSARLSWRNRIDRKHIDFLLCDPRTMHPVLGVELDDRSHALSHRQERDRFVERVFADAGLPLLRTPVLAEYNMMTLQKSIDEALGAAPNATLGAPNVSSSERVVPEMTVGSAPACPRCGTAMVKRIASRGPNAGTAFWGCPNYPRCRGTLPMGTRDSSTP